MNIARILFLLTALSLPALGQVVEAPGTTTTINSLVASAIDAAQFQAIVAQAAPTLTNVQFYQHDGQIDIIANRVMTSAEISALKAACVAALFKVTTN